jgi:hypothetical protein
MQAEEQTASGTSLKKEGFLERRGHTRYALRALVEFEWIDNGLRHSGRGTTRDISTRGMFIYSDSQPPSNADLQVEVSFRAVTEQPTNLQLSTKALVVRVDPAASQDGLIGFAILNRSYNLHDGLTSIDKRELKN